MINKILVIGENRIQYYAAKYLAKGNFAVFYYGVMPYEKLTGVKQVDSAEKLWELLGDEACLVVLPMESLDIMGEQAAFSILDLKGQNKHMTDVSCEFWKPARKELLEMRLADLLAEAAVVEAKLLGEKSVADSVSIVVGFNICGETISRKLRGWGGKVFVWPDDETEASLAGYRGCLLCEKQGMGCQKAEEQALWHKPDYVFLCSNHQKLRARQLHQFENSPVIVNITDCYQGIDMAYARMNHFCVKHADHLLDEYAPRETGRLLAGMVMEHAGR